VVGRACLCGCALFSNVELSVLLCVFVVIVSLTRFSSPVTDSGIIAIQATGALSTLLSLLKTSSSADVTKACAAALRACARNLKAQMELHQMGGLDYLGLKYPLIK